MISNETHASEVVGVDETLERALALLEEGRPQSADSLLTWALIEDGDKSELWMAAGLARLRRGAFEAARSAFTMSAWISGDPLAAELAGVGLEGW